MIYFLIIIGLGLILFSVYLKKKEKKDFAEILNNVTDDKVVKVVNNTYEEIEMKTEVKEMKEKINILMKSNSEIVELQKQTIELKRLLADIYNETDNNSSDTRKINAEILKPNFLDSLADETGLGKGDLLLLEKSL